MVKIAEYIAWRQPLVLEQLWRGVITAEEELTPFQQYLDRLMRQPPRAGVTASEQ